MEREYRTGTVFDIVVIGEADHLVRGFIGKTDLVIDLDVFERTVSIARGLFFNSRDVFSESGLLRFNDSDGLAIHKKRIVNRTGTRRELSYRYACTG